MKKIVSTFIAITLFLMSDINAQAMGLRAAGQCATDGVSNNVNTQKGENYFYGCNVKQSYRKSRHYFELAFAQGDAKAAHNLGVMYYQGLGVSIDPTKAIFYYQMAAKQNLALSQYSLGTLYLRGEIVEQDYSKAMDYYEQAASNNNVNALYELGWVYNEVWGLLLIPKNQ